MNSLKNIFKSNKDIEIELKVGKFYEKQFSADVNEVVFEKIKDYLIQNKYKQLPLTECIMCKKGSNRIEFYLNEKKDVIHYEEMNKKKLRHYDFPKLDLRLSVSKETIIEKKDMNKNNVFKEQIKCLRYKKRASYSKDIWRFDLTQVYDIKNSMSIAEIIKNISSHKLNFRLEVEIEYIGKNMTNLKKEIHTIYDEIKHIINYKYEALSKIQKILKNKEYKTIISKNVSKWTSHELITQVQNLNKTTLNNIINGELTYSITEKADGERYLLYLNNNDIFKIDKSLNLNFLQNLNDNKVNKLTNDDKTNFYLLDVEFLYPNTYLVFDCIIYDGKDISSESLDKRISYINKFCNNDKFRNLFLKLKIEIKMKKHIYSNKTNIFKICKQIYLDTKYTYDIDGLIFTPIEEQYRTNVYKWKPPEEQTIDFLIIIKYRRKLENLSMELILDLYVKGPKNKFKYNYKLFKNIHKNSPNVPVLFSKNNSIIVNFKENDMYYENILIKPFSIIEMIYKNGSWFPFKNRFDKEKEFREYMKKGIFEGPNSFNNAMFIKNLILNPITTEMISTGQIYYIGVNKKNSSIQNMIKYNNLIKKDMYTSHLKRNMTLLELSGGRGGNLYDFLDKHPQFVYFTDYAKDALTEAERRYNYIVKEEPSYKTNILFKEYDLRENICDKLSENANCKFDLISCHFAIHYFFETETTWKNFFNTIDKNIKSNGKFMFTCFDGKRVHKMLDKIKKNQKLEFKIKEKVVLGFTKLYDGRKKSVFGRTIGCFVETIGEHNEYLVDLEFLYDYFKTRSYKLIETIPFNSLFENYNIRLTEVEKKFTGLYNKVVFEKI